MEAKRTAELVMPGELLDRLDTLYPQLNETVPEHGTTLLDVPALDELVAGISGSSFKIFDDPRAYEESQRARAYPSWSSSRLDEASAGLYRVFFNGFSGKVYVDLNRSRIEAVRTRSEEERLYCEILRTLIIVLTCEASLAGAGPVEATPAPATGGEPTRS